MNSIVVILATAAAVVSSTSVPCDTKGVACMTSAACDAFRGEIHPHGACNAASSHVCCVMGVRPLTGDGALVAEAKNKNALSAEERKRQFGGLFGNILDTVNTVKNVVNGVMMLSNLANGLNMINMLANAIPTIPPIPTLPAITIPPITIPPITAPTLPPYTIPVIPTNTQSLPPATLPGPRTNPRSGLPIGVDPNNPLGLATNAAGQFINDFGVVVDRYGDIPKQTNPTYAGVSQLPQFTTQPVVVGTQPTNAVPGGMVDNNADNNGEEIGTTDSASDTGLGIGAYVGIGVVSFVCVVLLCVMVFCVASRSRDSTTYNVKNSAYDPQQAGAPAWGVPMSNQFGSFNQQPGMSFSQPNNGMSFQQQPGVSFGQPAGFGAGTANFNTHTSFVSAADLPSPSGALRRDTNNAGYGIGVAASTTGTQNFNGGTGAVPSFACPHCSKMYFYQTDVDAHVAARHDAHGF